MSDAPGLVLVLCYHSLSENVTSPWILHPNEMAEHITALQEMGYTIVPLKRLSDPIEHGAKLAVLTFDDGRGEYPAVQQPATFFVCPRFTDGNAPNAQRYTEFLSWDELQKLVDVGQTIGSHSLTHTEFSKLPTAKIWEEINGSRKIIEVSLTLPEPGCFAFAAPFGSDSGVSREMARTAGYQFNLTTGDRINVAPIDPYQIYRYSVQSPCPAEKFVAEIRRLESEALTAAPAQPDTPEFSFIIPARNEGPVLLETLKNLRSFGPPSEVEIILVDDASDPPLFKAHEIPEDVHVIRQERSQGMARARNTGASIANGRVLIFTDGHVCFSANFLDELRKMELHKSWGIAGCATSLVRTEEQLQQAAAGQGDPRETYYGWRLVLSPQPHVEPNNGPVLPHNQPVAYVGGAALAIGHELFTEIGGFDKDLIGIGCSEDLEIAINCWRRNLSVIMNPNATCWHLTQDVSHDSATPNEFGELDIPRYPGSFSNLVRILYQHFPNELFEQLAKGFRDAALDAGLPQLDEYLSRMAGQKRRDTLQTVSQITPQELLQKLTYNPQMNGELPPLSKPVGHSQWANVELRQTAQVERYREWLEKYPARDFVSQPNESRHYQFPNDWIPLSDAWTTTAIAKGTIPARAIILQGRIAEWSGLLLDAGLPASSITAIHPTATDQLQNLQENARPEVIESDLQNVPMSTFYSLVSGDMLFVNCLHRLDTDGEMAYMLTRILPILAPGVLVHFHTMYFDFSYPANWDDRGYNAAQAIAAILANQPPETPRLRIVAFNSLMGAQHPELFQEQFPEFLENMGGSFWIQTY